MRFFDFGTTFVIVAGLVLITAMFAIDGFTNSCCSEALLHEMEGGGGELTPVDDCWPARSIKCSRL